MIKGNKKQLLTLMIIGSIVLAFLLVSSIFIYNLFSKDEVNSEDNVNDATEAFRTEIHRTDTLTEDILTPDDFGSGVEPTAVEANTTRPNYEPGSAIVDITALNGDSIKVVLGSNQQDNMLLINDTSTGIENVYGVSLSFDEKYVYYTKFVSTTLDDGFILVDADGKVYQYDIEKKSEEILYSFGNEFSFSFKVNSKYIFYASGENEVGKIDLVRKEKTKFDTSKITINTEVEVHGDVGEYTPLSVLSIDEEFATLAVDNPNGEPNLYRIRLSNLNIEE